MMSDSEQQHDAEQVCEAQWPENGEDWSDGEDGTDMDSGLLQAMAEEDEEINVHNEETFGMDLDANGTTEESSSILQFGEALPPTPPPATPPPATPPPPHPKPRSPRRAPSPPRQKPQYFPRASSRPRGRSRGQRGALGRGQMFEDPAVMRIIEGRPSLKSLDSAIVDCGTALYQRPFEDDTTMPSYRKTRRTSGSILEDSAIVCVIGHRGRGQHLNSNFIDSLYSAGPLYGVRRGESRGLYSRRQFGHRGPTQVYPPIVPRSPLFPRQPLTPRQHYNQARAFMFPPTHPYPSTPQTPKMMQLRFGANSPRPSPFYSPSSNPVQPFRYPGPATQLHPQHKRLLSQKQRLFQRKPEGWDPYCNLMTAKEKEWITRLQMIQLQSENPYLEDYYYQEYYRRIESKMAEEELGIRSKREPPKLTTPYVKKTDSYTPVVHIEGSLGQVAVSTCYSPRRAISAVHAVQPQGLLEDQKDTRLQRLDILSKIEKLFMVLLEVEETERMKTPLLSEAEERRSMEKTQRKVEHIYSQLQHHNPLESGGEFLPFLLISKGKKLIARLLPFLKHDSALNILHIVTTNLPTLMSRDTDEPLPVTAGFTVYTDGESLKNCALIVQLQEKFAEIKLSSTGLLGTAQPTLPVLYPPLRNVIGGLAFSQLIGVIKDLTSLESLTYECLELACQNKFGLSLLYALLSQGEKLLSSGVPLEPSIGDFEAWTDIIFQVAGQLSQCSLVEPLLLPSNLLTLFCRYLDKRTVHQLKSNMESVTGCLALPS